MPGKRYSRQRELIYRCVQGTKLHPSAEMVYHWLKPENPGLSLGTVYRNLNLLSEEGLLLRLPFDVDRYDANVSAHAHLHCRRCGAVFDLSGDCEPFRAMLEQQNPLIRVDCCRLICEGLCADCQTVESAAG